MGRYLLILREMCKYNCDFVCLVYIFWVGNIHALTFYICSITVVKLLYDANKLWKVC